jgi:DNA-3-methyladenine glycosylase II
MPSMVSFALPVRMPFDWESLLAFLRLRATPGVETVTDSAYARTVTIGVAPQTLSVTFDPISARLRVVYSGNKDSGNKDSGNKDSRNTSERSMVASRVKQIFKTEVSTGPIEVFLGRDAWLGGLVGRRPGLRVPGGWCGFEIAVRAILGQQVSVPAATTLMGRLVRIAGSRLSETSWLFPAPELVL